MDETRRLYRSETDRMLGGVCGGLGEYFGIDATVLRLGFVAAVFIAGFGPVLYLIMWIVVPRRSRLEAPPNEAARDGIEEVREQAQRGVQEARSAYERWRAGSSGNGSSAPADEPPPKEEGEPSPPGSPTAAEPGGPPPRDPGGPSSGDAGAGPPAGGPPGGGPPGQGPPGEGPPERR